MTQTPRALVFGASGYIGSNLVPHLQSAGWDVRAAGRNKDVLATRGWQGVELVQADALSPETLAAALSDVDVAFFLFTQWPSVASSATWTLRPLDILLVGPASPGADAIRRA